MANKKGKNSSKLNNNKSNNKQETKQSRNEKQQKRKNIKGCKKLRGNAADDTQLYAAVEADGTRTILKMSDDGNCLFRSISDQLYRDHGDRHADVRADVCDYLEAHEGDFSGFLVLLDDEKDGGNVEEDAHEDFSSYVRAMRQDGEWGGNLELVVAARLYRRNIVVFSANLAAFTIDHDGSSSEKKPAGPDLLISYHDNQHYNSVRDNSNTPLPPVVKTFVRIEKQADGAPSGDEEEGSESARDGTSDVKTESTEQVKEQDMTVVAHEAAIVQTDAKPKIAKKSQCPCGSGLRYKKCCLSKAKHAARVRNLRSHQEEDQDADEAGGSEDEHAPEMHGAFRVLKI